MKKAEIDRTFGEIVAFGEAAQWRHATVQSRRAYLRAKNHQEPTTTRRATTAANSMSSIVEPTPESPLPFCQVDSLVKQGIVGWKIIEQVLQGVDQGTNGPLRDGLFTNEDDPPMAEPFLGRFNEQCLKISNIVRHQGSLFSSGRGELFGIACPSGAEIVGRDNIISLFS